MQRTSERSVEIAELRSYSNRTVCVRLDDASEHIGTLRTDLLSDSAISVFLAGDGNPGATLYIDEIVSVAPVDPAHVADFG